MKFSGSAAALSTRAHPRATEATGRPATTFREQEATHIVPAQLFGPEVRKLTSTLSGVSIPCISAKGMVFMAWSPTPEEKQSLLEGSPVWVAARGPWIPEMTLRVGPQEEVIPYDLQQAAVMENAPGGDVADKAAAQHRARSLTASDRMWGRFIVQLGAALGTALLLGIILRMVL